MIIVLGCGFVGTNAIVKILQAEGVFMGDTWLIPNKDMHPYPVLEDAEIGKYTYKEGEWDDEGVRAFINKRINEHDSNWGFKAPNFFMYIAQFMAATTALPHFIAGDRDDTTLVSRMVERWGWGEQRAYARIRRYRKTCEVIKRFYPLLWIDQQELLHEREENVKKIKEFIK